MQNHIDLLETMRVKARAELEAMGEHGLADGSERIDAEAFIQGAVKFQHKQASLKAKAKKANLKAKAQKQARKKNRK